MSTALCEVVESKELSVYLEERCIRLIQCFLDPSRMLKFKESPNTSSSLLVDPIYEFFHSGDLDQLGMYVSSIYRASNTVKYNYI